MNLEFMPVLKYELRCVKKFRSAAKGLDEQVEVTISPDAGKPVAAKRQHGLMMNACHWNLISFYEEP